MDYLNTIFFLLNFFYVGVCQYDVCVEDTSVLFSNLSLNKPASQSSLNGPQGFAWRANDGDKNSNYGDWSCSHVAVILDNHWWQVDLQNTYSVTSVTIVNRNKSASRLHDFGIEVSLSDQDDGNGRLKEAKLCHYHTGGGIGGGEERTFPCMAGAVGQYVRIYKQRPQDKYDALTLCEVEVSGYRSKCDVLNTTSLTTTDVTIAHSLPESLCDCRCINMTAISDLVDQLNKITDGEQSSIQFLPEETDQCSRQPHVCRGYWCCNGSRSAGLHTWMYCSH